MTDLKSIVAGWLAENGYDGLYSRHDCACEVSDLMPCGEPGQDCAPGYKGPCVPSECAADGDCDWHIHVARPTVERGERK